jgi:hypothetical protein
MIKLKLICITINRKKVNYEIKTSKEDMAETLE